MGLQLKRTYTWLVSQFGIPECKKLNKESGITVILVTHDPSVAKQAERTVSISDGKIINE